MRRNDKVRTTRLIDADKLKEQLKERYMAAVEWQKNTIDYKSKAEGAISAFLETIRVLNNAPIVDAVLVVRCKDCSFGVQRGEYSFCNLTRLCVKNDGYCNYGEQKRVKENDY